MKDGKIFNTVVVEAVAELINDRQGKVWQEGDKKMLVGGNRLMQLMVRTGQNELTPNEVAVEKALADSDGILMVFGVAVDGVCQFCTLAAFKALGVVEVWDTEGRDQSRYTETLVSYCTELWKTRMELRSTTRKLPRYTGNNMGAFHLVLADYVAANPELAEKGFPVNVDTDLERKRFTLALSHGRIGWPSGAINWLGETKSTRKTKSTTNPMRRTIVHPVESYEVTEEVRKALARPAMAELISKGANVRVSEDSKPDQTSGELVQPKDVRTPSSLKEAYDLREKAGEVITANWKKRKAEEGRTTGKGPRN